MHSLPGQHSTLERAACCPGSLRWGDSLCVLKVLFKQFDTVLKLLGRLILQTPGKSFGHLPRAQSLRIEGLDHTLRGILSPLDIDSGLLDHEDTEAAELMFEC